MHPEELEDDLFHFFVDCWQLKDWIINDSENISHRKRKSIASAVHADTTLMQCRDIANARKHLKLRKKRKGRPLKPDAAVIGEIRVGGEGLSIDYVVVNRRGKKIARATELAKKAVQRWTEILAKHRLKISATD